MKKKNLKNLRLHTHKISNLTLLYRNVGGKANTNVDTMPTINTNDLTIVRECQTKYESCVFSECITNGGDTKAPPPSEYEGCLQNSPFL